MYNKVRNFSVREDKRKNRLMDKEDKATTEKALDPKTRVLIYKLVNGGLLDSVNGVISMGKEAVIFHADGGPGPQDCHRPKPYKVPKECVLKVFKTTLNEFKTRDKYIRVRITTFLKSHLINQPKVSLTHFLISGRLQVPQKIHKTESSEDPQHVGREGEGWNDCYRLSISSPAGQEMRNLVRMSRGGIRVPEVVLLRNQVLLMSFIGRDGRPAPKLKEAAERMSAEELGTAYNQVNDDN